MEIFCRLKKLKINTNKLKIMIKIMDTIPGIKILYFERILLVICAEKYKNKIEEVVISKKITKLSI